MYKKVVICILFILFCSLDVNAQDCDKTKTVSMKPNVVYYDSEKGTYFTPNRRVRMEGENLYKRLKRSNKIKIKYTDDLKTNSYWSRVYDYVNKKYFKYDKLTSSSQLSDGDYLVDTYKSKDYKYKIKLNKSIEKDVKKIIKSIGIDENTTEYDAVIKINKYIIDNYEYNHKIQEGYDEGYNSTKRIYSMFYTKTGVCIDYAYTFQILCQEVGIKCGLVSDEVMCHAFNICNIGGVDYYFDVTWNDCGYDDAFSFMSYNDLIEQNRVISDIRWDLR